MSTVAFSLLTYRPDHPSGIERAIGALVSGVRAAGHRAVVIAAGPPQPGDAAEPELIRLSTVRLPRPVTKDAVEAAVADEPAIRAEVRAVLAREQVDLVCWGAATWGLGHLGAAPPGVGTALLIHNTIRPGGSGPWRRAIAAADVVCPASPYLMDAYTAASWDTRGWRLVPNALITAGHPPNAADRERLRRAGPIRIVSRADPDKGHAGFLAAMPPHTRRRVELVLAEADFEFTEGAAAAAMAACRREVDARPGRAVVLPGLPWRQVPGFFAGAAATVIASTQPETFSFTAAEALSAGTPAVTFDLGHPPALIGPAGRTVPLEAGFAGLWRELESLLEDPDGYHAASRAAPGRVAAHTPAAAAHALLAATGLAPDPSAQPDRGIELSR